MERLAKLIAHSGLVSRRKAEELIRAGRVTVDGAPAHLGQKVDGAAARVEVDGTVLPLRPGLVYYLLNKPAGVVSTAHDPQGRPTVVEMVPDDRRVYPVGRLDLDSEGLILLTNDGSLAELLTHPSHQVPRTYSALVDGRPTRADLRRLTEGVSLEDGPARAMRARLLEHWRGRALVEVVMGEGRKRELRRMFDLLGHPVARLVRTGIGPLRLGALRPGSWRPLSIAEVRALYRAGGG